MDMGARLHTARPWSRYMAESNQFNVTRGTVLATFELVRVYVLKGKT